MIQSYHHWESHPNSQRLPWLNQACKMGASKTSTATGSSLSPAWPLWEPPAHFLCSREEPHLCVIRELWVLWLQYKCVAVSCNARWFGSLGTTRSRRNCNPNNTTDLANKMQRWIRMLRETVSRATTPPYSWICSCNPWKTPVWCATEVGAMVLGRPWASALTSRVMTSPCS